MKKTLLPLIIILMLNISFAQENGKSIDNDPQIITLNEQQIAKTNFNIAGINTIHAGDAIEGDYFAEIKFSPDGEEIWVLHRTTNNITVIDWTTKAILQNIQVGNVPLSIDFTADYAVVACYGSDNVYILNTDDYTTAAIVDVAGGPGKVHISNNGNIAVIGSDTSDTGTVIDLTTLAKTITIPNFPVEVVAFSSITNSTRSIFYMSNFRVTPDGLHVINGRNTDGLKFYNTTTGAITATISDAASTNTLELSGDGTKLIAVRNGNNGVVYQINVDTQTLNTQVSTGEQINQGYSPPAVNIDGNKIFVPSTSANTLLFDMVSANYQAVAIGNTPSWVGINATGDTFIAGGYYLTTVDVSHGNVLDISSGISLSLGAIGTNNRIAASSPLRYESVLTRNFVDPSNIVSEGVSSTGSALEADVCYFMKFTPNEEKLLSINNISGTVSVIDVVGETLETIIPLDTYNISSVDITSDSNYAIVPKRKQNKVAIIDLQTNQVVADLSSGGQGPSSVKILPGDQFAYVINGSNSDRIGVIALDGASSTLNSSFIIGNAGTSFTNKGIQSDLQFTQDGQFGLFASSFTDEVEIIDLNTHQIVSAIPTVGFPLQIAIKPETSATANNEIAAVTLKSAAKIAILERNGTSWSLQGTYNCGIEPVRVDYDNSTNSFWVTSSDDKKIQQFSLDSYSFINEISYSPHRPLAVRNATTTNRRFDLVNTFDLNNPSGNRLFVTTNGVTESLELPGLSSHNFDITKTGSYAGIGHWGSDTITIFKDILLGGESVTINLNKPFVLYPNPVEDVINFHGNITAFAGTNITLKIIDINGKLVSNEIINTNNQTLEFKRSKVLTTGTYLYQLHETNKLIQKGKLIVK